MGLAASQARLLTLTARIHDVEYQAQMIQSAKLTLAIKEDEAYRRYTDALDAQTLTFRTDTGNLIAANFNNLCGKASMSNGLSKNYIFRTNDGSLKDDLLILPDDVYEAYQSYGGDDPYAFAMSMIGVDINGVNEDGLDYDSIVENYMTNVLDSNNGQTLENLQEQIRTLVKEKIWPKTAQPEDEQTLEAMINDTNLTGFSKYFPDGKIPEDVRDSLDKLESLRQQFQYKLYSTGAEDIYAQATGLDKSKFAQNETDFNYYLHWGQLIENEGGLSGCIKVSDYGDENVATDANFLTSMIECGRITVDLVSFKNGVVSDNITSAASDSNLAMTNTSEVDGKELKKAEAEYEHTMKQISRKDKQYDMDLNRLETERTALTTEYDSVKKVIQDNVERTFGIFS